jgi:N-acyl-D-amino-acid deacylase
MHIIAHRLSLALLALGFISAARMARAADDPSHEPPTAKQAIERAIVVLEKGSAGSAKERTCFTCHSQAMPILALTAAGARGFSIDGANLRAQLDHTAAHLNRGKERYASGRGQGGKALTAGYALWALAAGDRAADETTTAVAGYLLKHQADADHWSQSSGRPPSSGSDYTATYLALYGLNRFATEEQQAAVAARRATVARWLAKSPGPAEEMDTEDRVFRLLALHEVDADRGVIAAAAKDLLDTQRDDGGWAQTAKLASDAYATGSALFALAQAGGVEHDNEAYRRGVQYLLDTQLPDGSWRVETRAKGFQEYFETGFPHGKDQFISTSATAWAALALLETAPPARTLTDSGRSSKVTEKDDTD